jgi:hypothetical protein
MLRGVYPELLRFAQDRSRWSERAQHDICPFSRSLLVHPGWQLTTHHSPLPLSVLSFLGLEAGNEAVKQPAAPGVIKFLTDHRFGLLDGLLDGVVP